MFSLSLLQMAPLDTTTLWKTTLTHPWLHVSFLLNPHPEYVYSFPSQADSDTHSDHSFMTRSRAPMIIVIRSPRTWSIFPGLLPALWSSIHVSVLVHLPTSLGIPQSTWESHPIYQAGIPVDPLTKTDVVRLV